MTKTGCKLYDSSDQTIANVSTTAVDFDSEFWDTDSFHESVTWPERITIPTGKDGWYLFHCHLHWASNSTGVRIIKLYKNSSEVTRVRYVSDGESSMDLYHLDDAAAAKFYEIRVYQASGGNLNVDMLTTAHYTTFSCIRLGE